nr:hypothetical protein [Nucisporomicrobium flavum]
MRRGDELFHEHPASVGLRRSHRAAAVIFDFRGVQWLVTPASVADPAVQPLGALIVQSHAKHNRGEALPAKTVLDRVHHPGADALVTQCLRHLQVCEEPCGGRREPGAQFSLVAADRSQGGGAEDLFTAPGDHKLGAGVRAGQEVSEVSFFALEHFGQGVDVRRAGAE